MRKDFLQICEGILKLENLGFLRKNIFFRKYKGVLDENTLFYLISQELYYSEESNINTNLGHSAQRFKTDGFRHNAHSHQKGLPTLSKVITDAQK